MDLADHGFVKRYDERDAGRRRRASARDLPPGAFRRRTDRPYRIYPDPPFEGEIVHRELEYMVPFEHGKDAFMALRSLILQPPAPQQVPGRDPIHRGRRGACSRRSTERDSISVSICGHRDNDYHGFLTAGPRRA